MAASRSSIARENPAADLLDGLEMVTPEQFDDDATLKAVFAELRSETDQIQGLRRIFFFAARLPIEDIPRAVALAREKDSEGDSEGDFLHEFISTVLLHRLAQADPEAAAEYLGGDGIGRNWNDDVLSAPIARAMAERDVQRAFDWALSLKEEKRGDSDAALLGVLSALRLRPPGEALDVLLERAPKFAENNSLPGTILQLWGAQMPERAGEALLSLPASRQRDRAIAQLAQNMAAEDPVAGLAWAQQLPLEGRGVALAGIISGLARTEPAAAAEKLPLIPAGSDARAKAANDIASEWAAKDMAAAVTWASALEDEGSQTAAAGAISRQFKAEQIEQQVSWLGTLQAGKPRDAAVGAFVDSVRDRDPEAAADWALTIADEKEREQRLVRVGLAWRAKDEAAARAWFSSRPEIPQSVTEKFLPPLNSK